MDFLCFEDCICGEFIVSGSLLCSCSMLTTCFVGGQLVIDKSLASLPRRRTDNAIIIRTQDSDSGKARVFKLNTVSGDPILLERYAARYMTFLWVLNNQNREGGHERQYRSQCPRCSLAVGYQSTPPPVKSAPYFYIIPGALTQMQGQIPEDAFDGQ